MSLTDDMSWCLKRLNPKRVFPEQKQVHFRLRNRHSGLVMALAGDLDDIKMMRIQETEENGELEQIWFYQNGSLHSKVSRAAGASSGLGVNNTNGPFFLNNNPPPAAGGVLPGSQRQHGHGRKPRRPRRRAGRPGPPLEPHLQGLPPLHPHPEPGPGY